MKKQAITISYDEEKLSALRLYLKQKETSVELELQNALDQMFNKNVPAGVRSFISMRANLPETVTPKLRKTRGEKLSQSKDEEAPVQEDD